MIFWIVRGLFLPNHPPATKFRKWWGFGEWLEQELEPKSRPKWYKWYMRPWIRARPNTVYDWMVGESKDRVKSQGSFSVLDFRQQRIWKIAKEGGGAMARRAPLHPGLASPKEGPTVVIGGTFRRKFSSFALEGAGPEKPLEGLSGGTFRRWRGPEGALQLHFPCKTCAIGGRRTIAKGAFGAQGGAWPSAPLPTPLVWAVH